MKDLEKELKSAGVDGDALNIHLAESRGSIYRDMKVIAGLQEPTSFLHRAKSKRGYISQLGSAPGKQSKEGFFQDKVLERKQDLVGRSTIILNPDLGGDQIGLPKEMAGKLGLKMANGLVITLRLPITKSTKAKPRWRRRGQDS
jgi:hypothetical protein